MIGKGERIGDLYILNNANHYHHCFVNTVSLETWHMRLGHPSFERLNLLKEKLNLKDIKFDKHDDCNTCHLAKQKHLSFSSNNHFSANIFDLIHCDIWGPYHLASHTGHEYFLTLVDDCSRFVWVYMLKQKFDALIAIPRFFTMVMTQFDKKK